MKINKNIAKNLLKNKEFKNLFIEELGWDYAQSQSLNIQLKSDSDIKYQFSQIAQKRGFVVYLYNDTDKSFPDYQTRRKLERSVAKYTQEHFIIFIDNETNTQIWQWVKLETGKPAICREHKLHNEHSGELFIPKLEKIAFTLDEEQDTTLIDVKSRMHSAIDVEKVTKKFYERFQKEHDVFMNFISGIPDEENQKWYASIMLNRLMFTYFVQKKGFLDDNVNYLRNRLDIIKEKHGKGEFYSFYRSFLRRLFHEGLDQKEIDRSDDLKQLIGKIPYLNGGIFQVHQLENLYKDIDISDTAFEKLFDFFDQFDWHLDDRPLKRDNEINPDVLGYIFEKYINQKQMGAYYTKEDITEYISKNTIIPRLFDLAKEKCKIAFDDNSPIWDLLKEDPDRYIYDAVKKGTELQLPENIDIGIDTEKPNLIERRGDWNKPASNDFALPTEIWRETIARRQRYCEVKSKLENGEINSINDFITYNLNICQFAQDVIGSCEGPELLRAFYFSIAGRIPVKSNDKFHSGMTILDPTCGSGAFLFAALNILEPLYEACIDRMQSFVDELENQISGKEKYKDFRKILAEVDNHPTPKYFIYKTIILNNLFGVDIMDEAVEICKLRLFLKLAAQVEKVDDIEPLPDIDFNIRAGNTLVGFVNYEEVEKAVCGSFDDGTLGIYKDMMPEINEKAREADMAFKFFRRMQQNQNVSSKDFSSAKIELRKRLATLENQLNVFLAKDYGVSDPNSEKYQNWLKSYKPFHWYVDFYGIIHIDKGFDVIIGNPPYVKYSKVKKDYILKSEVFSTLNSGNLYAYCIERAFGLQNNKSRFAMIIPIASISTNGMSSLQSLYNIRTGNIWHSHYATRPGKLFSGVDMNLTITIADFKINQSNVYSTIYNRWYDGHNTNRKFIFSILNYKKTDVPKRHKNGFPKIGNTVESELLKKMHSYSIYLMEYYKNDESSIFYHSGGRYWRKAIQEKLSSHYKPINVSKEDLNITLCLLNSQLFYWYWITNSNCMDVVSREVNFFPVFHFINIKNINFKQLKEKLLNEYFLSTKERKRTGNIINNTEINFDVKKSKSIIDKIDKVLAEHYGFTEEELDYIINYDIKYRMGKELNTE